MHKKEATEFHTSKDILTSSQLLVQFDPQMKLILSCDDSAYGTGSLLAHQMPDGSEQPIGFISCTLSSAKKLLRKDGLACVFGVKIFHSNLYGHHFTTVTDHKPLSSHYYYLMSLNLYLVMHQREFNNGH